MEGEKPEVGQARAQQPIQLRWRGGDPAQEGLQLSLELVAGWRLEVQAFSADGTQEHQHRGSIAQLTDPNCEQSILSSGRSRSAPGRDPAAHLQVQRGFQPLQLKSGAFPAELGPVRLLPDPG